MILRVDSATGGVHATSSAIQSDTIVEFCGLLLQITPSPSDGPILSCAG